MASNPAPKEPVLFTPTGRKISALRRCAKCARRCRDSEFKNEKGEFTPYDSECRARFPSLSAAHCVVTTKVARTAGKRR